MALNVSDLLTLPILREGRLAAGMGGLSHRVRAVSFTDCPIVFCEDEYALTKPGDLYIFNYTPYRMDREHLLNQLRFYIKTRSSCCIVMMENLAQFPDEAIDLANQSGYPVILLSDRIAYADVIRAITEAIYLNEANGAAEQKLARLLFDSLSPEDSEAIAKSFFSFRQPGYLAAFLSAQEVRRGQEDLRRELASRMNGREVALFGFREQLLLIVGLAGPEEERQTQKLLLQAMEPLFPQFYLGLSTVHFGAETFAQAVREAFQSCRIGRYQRRPVTLFGQDTYWNLLYELRHHPALVRFQEETLRPLWAYQDSQGVDLVETLREFFRCDGNYKRAAAALFQHENTVRFRVAKAKSLLGMEGDNCRFTREASLAIDCFLLQKELS